MHPPTRRRTEAPAATGPSATMAQCRTSWSGDGPTGAWWMAGRHLRRLHGLRPPRQLPPFAPGGGGGGAFMLGGGAPAGARAVTTGGLGSATADRLYDRMRLAFVEMGKPD